MRWKKIRGRKKQKSIMEEHGPGKERRREEKEEMTLVADIILAEKPSAAKDTIEKSPIGRTR